MAYRQQGSLTALFDARTVPPVARAVADDVGEEWTRRAARLTPVDTGELRSRWRSLDVEKVPGGYESGTQNASPIAHLIENGVAPHDLGKGKRQGAQHPGQEGAFMLARSAEEIVTELEAIAQPRLSAWASRLEADATAD